MKGFMRRRGDAWELRVYLGIDPVTGKQRYATRTVRGRKREAQRTLNEMVTDAERGLSVRTNATAGELIEAWFEHAARDFSPKTVKETRGFIDRNLLPAIGDVPLSKLDDRTAANRPIDHPPERGVPVSDPRTGRQTSPHSRCPNQSDRTAGAADRSPPPSRAGGPPSARHHHPHWAIGRVKLKTRLSPSNAPEPSDSVADGSDRHA